MSQPYPGVAPLTVHTSGAGAPGVIVSTGAGDVHGNFPIVTEMVGPDKRFAGNLMQPSENLTDRVNWLGWRALDIWAGGDYRGPISEIILSNTLALYGSTLFAGPSFVVNGQTLSIGLAGLGNGSIEVHSGSTFTTDSGSTTTLAGAATVTATGSITVLPDGSIAVTGSSGHPGVILVQSFAELLVQSGGSVILQAGSVSTQSGSWTKSGNGAWTADRELILDPTGGATVADATQYDVIRLTNCNYTNGSIAVATNGVTLTDPANGTALGIRVRVCLPAGGLVTIPAGQTSAYIDVTAGSLGPIRGMAGLTGTAISHPAFVDFIVEQTSGPGRRWAPIAAS